jgi:predicted AlkP superfamily phosphohydrolase/phosphomutase
MSAVRADVRQLIIGLDAMEWSLVERWAPQGRLPTFQRLMREGVQAELASTAAQLPDTVWPCAYTGANPARFAKYFYVQYDPKTMGLRHLHDDAITATPFWEHLSRAGRRVAVVDVPKFAVSRPLGGIHLANWGAHGAKTNRASHPVGLLNEVRSRLGDHPVGDCDSVDATPGALERLRHRVLEGVRAHGQLFQWILIRESWDVFFGAFSAPHCIGHH